MFSIRPKIALTKFCKETRTVASDRKKRWGGQEKERQGLFSGIRVGDAYQGLHHGPNGSSSNQGGLNNNKLRGKRKES